MSHDREGSDDGSGGAVIGDRVSSIDLAVWLLLGGALALLIFVRAWIPYGNVFRDGTVVLAANDPYFYRYSVETLLVSDASPFSPSDLAGLPEDPRTHDVLFIVSAWAVADVLGGTTYAAGFVLAWYPVAAAVVMAGLLYVLTVDLTDDRRLGVLAVVILALIPAHAYRTMLGFGDHDAFHMLWVVVTAAALVRLTTYEASDRPWRDAGYWLAIGALAVGVAAVCLAWRGGPLLLAPLAVFACAVSVSCVRHGRSPVVENWGVLVGLVAASMLAAGLHIGLNWVEPYRAFAPGLLLALVVGIFAVGEFGSRIALPWPVTFGGASLVAGGWLAALWKVSDAFAGPLNHFVRFFGRHPWVEPRHMTGENVSLVADVQTPVMLFGLVLVFALPVMVGVLFKLRSAHRPGWIAISAYAWTFLALSVLLIRMSGLLAVFVAVFAAIGILYLVAWADVSWPPSLFSGRDVASVRMPTVDLADAMQTVGVVALVVIFVMGLGVTQVPATMDRITVDDTTYETATWMAEYSDEQGWTYPENYVFSEWGSNRAYNYVVSGESREYGHALANYREFVSSSDAEAWYEDLEGRAGFIVVQDTRFAYPRDSMQVRLNDRFGSAGDDVDGLAHYRLVYVSDDGTTSVFTLVPGATIVGNATANSTVQVETDVEVGDTTFTYQRSVQTGPDGDYEVTVPYPGRYTVGSAVVSVRESDVEDGETIAAEHGVDG